MLIFRDERHVEGDLFNAPETYKVITINCVGAMGKGIALACRERYPDLYENYRTRCRAGEITIGNVYLYEEEKIILLPTKTHFKMRSELSFVTTGIDALADLGRDLNESIAIPPLGMVNGWMKWKERVEVYHHLYNRLQPGETNYRVYLPLTLITEAKKALI
ncbi:putative Appr-1-p processing protein [Salmonella phage pSal-SNUABM-04]|nr:putative Appr-1-p processing protein [Salmonella phage pSal-SNUABM-04]